MSLEFRNHFGFALPWILNSFEDGGWMVGWWMEDGGIVNLEREISVICVYRILVELHVSGFLDATQE